MLGIGSLVSIMQSVGSGAAEQTDQRAMYTWIDAAGEEQDPIATPEKLATLIDFCDDHNVTTLFLDMWQYLGGGNGSSDKTTKMKAAIAAFKGLGGDRKVYALGGNTDWCDTSVTVLGTPIQTWVSQNITTKVAEYNASAAANEKFDGFHLDVEYYVPGVEQDPTDAIEGMDSLVTAMKAGLPGLEVGGYASFHLVEEFSGEDVTFNGKTASEGVHIMDMYDHVAVGAYQKRAEAFSDQAGQIAYFEPWMVYRAANTSASALYCACETTVVEPPEITYATDDKVTLEEEQDKIVTEFEGTSGFRGLAFHSYDGWSAMADEFIPGTISAVIPSRVTFMGGTTIVCTVDDSADVTAINVDGVECDDFARPSATTVSGTTPAHVAGTADVTIMTTSQGESDPFEIEYVDAHSTSGLEFWLWMGTDRRFVDASTRLQGIDDLADSTDGHAEDEGRNMLQLTAGTRPFYSVSEASMNGRAAIRTAAATPSTRRIVCDGGVFITAIPMPATHYDVFLIPAVSANYVHIAGENNGNLNTHALRARVEAGGGLVTDGTIEATFDVAANTKYVVCRVYNTDGTIQVYVNRYQTPTATASGGAGTRTVPSMSVGTFSNAEYVFSEKRIYSGAHNLTTRQEVMNELGDCYDVDIIA